MQDDIIEIPDGAGLSDRTRNDLVELWTSGDDVGFHDPYTPVYPPDTPIPSQTQIFHCYTKEDREALIPIISLSPGF